MSTLTWTRADEAIVWFRKRYIQKEQKIKLTGMKKITTLVQESEKDMLTEAASLSFEKDLNDLVAKYSAAMEAELQDQLKTKIADVLKKKAIKI